MKKALLLLLLITLPLLTTGCGGQTYDGSEKFYNSGMNRKYMDNPPTYMPDGEHDAQGNLLP